MSSYVLGIDIGGTNTKMGLVSSSGGVFARTTLPTKSFVRSKNRLMNALIEHCGIILKKNRLKKKDLLGIGIGLPGLIDRKRGIVNFLVNIPGWSGAPLKSIFEKRLHIPTFIDNDVNVIALGEWKFGAGKGVKNLVCITLGTGVGGGLIIGGNLFRGQGFCAGEIGHIPINERGPRCHCGGCGCLESYVGNQHLLAKARKVFGNRDMTLEDVTRLAIRNNKKAVQFWKDTAVHIGNGLSGVVNLLNPDCIIIGGGIANAHRFLFKTIHETIKKRAMKIPARMVRILKAKLGSDAGIIGAQVLVKEAICE